MDARAQLLMRHEEKETVKFFSHPPTPYLRGVLEKRGEGKKGGGWGDILFFIILF